MVIFFYGEDEVRSLEKLKEIEKKFLEKNSSGSGLSSFDFEEEKNIDFFEIKKAFASRGLFFEKQLVIIKNLIAFAPKQLASEVARFFDKSSFFEDKDLVVVFWEKGKINEKNELVKVLKKAKSQKFELLLGVKLNNRVVSALEKENNLVKISPGAVQKLIAFTGGDLRLIQNEIRKLANYKEEGKIDEKDIELLTKEKVSSNIFETIESLSGENKKNALKFLNEQIKKGEDPIYILMMYVYQFRNFLKVSEYYEKGERNNYAVAKKTKLHPFVVQKILGNISRFPSGKLKAIYKRLQAIDEKVKTGKGEIKTELECFIIEM